MLYIHKIALLAGITLLLVQAACTPAVQTTPMSIDEERYLPAVARYPASVGVYFPDDFYENNFYHVTNDGHEHTFHNNPADATRRALDLAFETTFSEVRYLESLQEGFEEEGLAFIVVPNIVSMVADLAPEVIAVMIVYQFEFFSDGEHIHSWQVSGVDSVYRSTMQGTGNQGVPSRAISPERFDTVARRAVWDATSVLLTELDQQRLLTDRLPAPVVNGKVNGFSRLTDSDRATLAMVGPVFDQSQDSEKNRLEDCLVEEVKDNGLSLTAVPMHDLREQLYPWFSRNNYPRRLNELGVIIQKPAVRARLQELGVQYVLSWDGETTVSSPEGRLYVTPYGIIGYKSADKTSVIKADLLAVEDGRVLTSFESTREGKASVLGLVLLPLPISSDTEEDACDEITRQIDHFIQVSLQHPQESR